MELKAYEQSGNTWVNKTYSVRGGWNIAVDGEGLVLNLERDFQTGDGPDLRVYVTSQDIAEIGSRDRADRHPTAVQIGIMPRAQGEQSYLLPTENFSQYRSILIHCKAYSVVWGGFAINA